MKILDFWVWDVISYLTSHFGQYKQGSPGRDVPGRHIKRGQANIDLQAIGSDTLNSRIRIFEIFKKFFGSQINGPILGRAYTGCAYIGGSHIRVQLPIFFVRFFF